MCIRDSSWAFLRYQICAYWLGIAFVISRGHNFERSIWTKLYGCRSPWQVHDSTSDVLSVSSWSYFDCSNHFCQFSVSDGTWWLLTKNRARSNIFGPSSDQRNRRQKLIASAKYQPGTIGNDGVPHEPLGILPDLFHRWSTTRLLHKKNTRTLLYCSTLLYHCIVVLLYCTTVLVL